MPDGSISRPQLHTGKKATRKEKASISTIFLGLAMRFTDNKREWAMVIHDGMGMVGSEQDARHGAVPDDVVDRILKRVKEYCDARGHRVGLFAISGPLDPPLNLVPAGLEVDREQQASFLSRIWLELDAIPFVSSVRDTQFSLVGEAFRAIEVALESLNPTSNSIIKAGVGPKHNVLVDADGDVHLYDLHQQAMLTSPPLWNTFTSLASALQKKNVRVSFFSATPRGGGVALMRHALIRVWRLIGMDVTWYVPLGDSAVFEVTKRKFHNVLQGVQAPGTKLEEEDKKLFEKWTNWNYEKYWAEHCTGSKVSDGGCPISADVVVIDDPQLTALIPIIRRESPKTKIIFRSHIEIRADLVDAGKSPQKEVFEYLFGFIKQADLFVSHPVKGFVPKMVRDHMPVVYMAPSTDALDGLNKPLPQEALEVYRHYFNDLARASTGQQLDWDRGYIIQVARFDPSKGIPDLTEGYRLFRDELKKKGEKASPQLILIGNTSVDDPDATNILHELQDQLATDPFKGIRDDIYALRAPPDDRLLNALLTGADVACQVSTREGYEIKVTEAIHKKRWIIATRVGGIPLQIRDGVDGTLVPPGDPRAISDALCTFYASRKTSEDTEDRSDGNDVQRPLGGRWTSDGDGPREELFTIGNASMWQFLWYCTLGLGANGLEDVPTDHQKTLGQLGLDSGRTLQELNESMVWDYLAPKA